jgi:hypothetical protein
MAPVRSWSPKGGWKSVEQHPCEQLTQALLLIAKTLSESGDAALDEQPVKSASASAE